MPLDEPSSVSPKKLKDYMEGTLRNRNPSDDELVNVLHSLGLYQSGSISDATDKERLGKGMQFLIGCHFGNYAEAEWADIVGELMFNGKLFGKETSNLVATKVTRSVTLLVMLGKLSVRE